MEKENQKSLDCIFFIISRGDVIGGAQIYLHTLISELALTTKFIHIIYGGSNKLVEDFHWPDNVIFLGLTSFKNYIRPFHDLMAFIKVFLYVKRFKPNLISLNSTKAGILFRFVGYFLSIPNVLTVHGWSFSTGVPLYKIFIFKKLERIFSFAINKYILVSKYDYNLAISSKIGPTAKMKIIYNGSCPNPYFKSSYKNFIGNPLKIIMVARFNYQKNQLLLMKACRLNKDVEITFAGDGPLLDFHKSYYIENKFACKINFLGFCRNVKKLLAENHLFVLTSCWEGFPISTVEAMSMRMPVIVSNVGGAGEAVIDGYNGFILKGKSEIELNSRINYFIKNPDLLTTMGNNSYHLYQSRFTNEVMVKKTKELFIKAIENNKIRS